MGVLLPGAILIAGLMLGFGIQPACAQFSAGGMQSPTAANPASMGAPRVMSPAEVEKQKQQREPDALPGAAPRSDRVAPAAAGVHIADPTEALFDAINRGDIASARDAIDRGADLDGHSVLGMTPLDLAVDLGRNDITFLLLSLRNGDSRPAPRVGTQSAQANPATKQPASAKSPAKPKVATRAPAAKPAVQTASATQGVPTSFGGDGGTPNATAGFLGFDNRH
jgi:hypothetical protein